MSNLKISTCNEYGLPIGFPVDKWVKCLKPPSTSINGNWCRLEILNQEKHAKDIFASYMTLRNDADWTYLPYGPFDKFEDFQTWLNTASKGSDPLFHAVIDNKTQKAIGIATYLRIEPAVGVIEVGHIHFSPVLQKTPLATEAMFLMMSRVFDELGYRRYEWKCDALNVPSKKAAERLGFIYEGTFRQATMYKNRNRDTAWFAIIDQDWPVLKSAFQTWLNQDNFDAKGQQKISLSEIRNKQEKR